MRNLVEGLGAVLVPVERKDDRRGLLRVAVESLGVYPVGTINTPPIGDPFGVEGYKTIAYEICEDLNWIVPAYVIVPVGHGDCFFGIWKGFKELQTIGLIDALPRMVGVEVVGALTESWSRGFESPAPVAPLDSIAFSISGNQVSYQALVALRESSGQGIVVTDDEVRSAQRTLATKHGVFAEHSSAAATAGAVRLFELGRLTAPGAVVVVSTSTGLKNPFTPAEKLTAVEPTLDGLVTFLSYSQVPVGV